MAMLLESVVFDFEFDGSHAGPERGFPRPLGRSSEKARVDPSLTDIKKERNRTRGFSIILSSGTIAAWLLCG
eukprot:scaffold25418_cov131-Skeletonema_dohrnii-CCMP3373.AAC.5